MIKSVHAIIILVTVCCMGLLTQGCKQESPVPKDADTQSQAPMDPHDALHQTKYNETLVEFPGHQYAMEIIDEKETTGLVSAFLTDAHFNPIPIDAKEVRLNFIVNGTPKTYTLQRTEPASEPATFTLTDMELATLNCEGWQGDATATVEIGGTPYSAKLTKLAGHTH